jgi:hypothetical protein
VGGWIGRWVEVKVVLGIAYSNNKQHHQNRHKVAYKIRVKKYFLSNQKKIYTIKLITIKNSPNKNGGLS